MVYSLSITTFQNHHERRMPCRNFILIQINLARNLLSKLCAKLFVFIRNIIFSDDFKSRHRLFAEDFTRDRKLPFHNLILLMLNLMRGSYQDELDHFFKALQQTDVAGRVVTKAALSKARVKLRYEAFRRSLTQPLLGQKIDKCLNPFHIENRAVRPDPILLRTGLKRVPESPSRCGFVLAAYVHKILSVQTFITHFRNRAIWNFHMILFLYNTIPLIY